MAPFSPALSITASTDKAVVEHLGVENWSIHPNVEEEEEVFAPPRRSSTRQTARSRHNMKLAFVSLLFSIFLSLNGVALAASKFETREDVLKDREERKAMIARAILPFKEKLADHYSGKHILLLDEKQVTAMENRIARFEAKLAALDIELTEEEIEKTIAGHVLIDALRNERTNEEL
eukprot:CAMPEP_0119017174 /NCGR_PEP_ID=MMETSP1176-20130426/15636_1 /TAXON_ID=265551 /ORGANISM="Synedropsis recta cf, Strain CCMP1620" /LENGTH=176 /DNA_ID=CAMNT_0006970815 /DNA_START=46 /DNA_END=576 /DNA_ORIENTATION=+